MIIPREILHLLFLIAGPQDFKTFRLVCKQWKRVVDSDEFKRVCNANPRCLIPERWTWLKNDAASDHTPTEQIQFSDNTISLFGDDDNTNSSPVEFDKQPQWPENACMYSWEDVVDRYQTSRHMTEQLNHYMKNYSNRIGIEMDEQEQWTKQHPEQRTFTQIKENSDWKNKLNDYDCIFQKAMFERTAPLWALTTPPPLRNWDFLITPPG